MASHSPADRRRPARVGVTLALASAASVGLLGETGHADPQLTTEQARAQVATLYQQAEQATQRYDGANRCSSSRSAPPPTPTWSVPPS
jgi:hypothetical protein